MTNNTNVTARNAAASQTACTPQALLATGPSEIYIEPGAYPEADEMDDGPVEMPVVTEEKKKR